MLDAADEAVFKAFRPRLFRAATGFLGAHASEAGDLVHDTYMVAAPRLKAAGTNALAIAWLRQICLRLCYARLRNRGGILTCLEDDLKIFMRAKGIQKTESENLDVAEQQELEMLRELIKQLTPDNRQMIELRNVHGMTYAQIQLTLDIPMHMVTARIAAARVQMREFLAGLPGNGSPNNLPIAA